MKISLNWLNEYVTWDGTPEELAERLTGNGLNVEEIRDYTRSFPGVVVADVVHREKHPDADKLSLCKVFDGEQTLQVVCGAPNVREGLKVLFARVGAVLPGDFKIKKSKIRGLESFGMICSAAELELGGDSSGIMELEDGPVAGTPADEVFGYRDTVLDIEVTPNRPDWLSHYGVAREVAAITGRILDVPEIWTQPLTGSESFDFTIEIPDFDDCPRYSAHFVSNPQIGPSPRWMQDRLLAIGERPINTVVDITNYVMFELGQPLHAFDLKKIEGKRIVVKRADPGQTFQTLDGKSHELTADDLVIADEGGAVALAGVMGGMNSDVGPETDSLLLESAFFDPRLVRDASRRLAIGTEASYRFERGADWDMVDFAAKRALHLLNRHAGASIIPGQIDRQNPDRRALSPLTLRIEQVNRLLGTDMKTPEVMAHLQALGFKTQPLGRARDHTGGSGVLTVEVPGFRRDVLAEVDLIEEVARMYGFSNIGVNPHFRGGVGVKRRPLDEVRKKLRRLLNALGFQETITSTFMSRRDIDRLGYAPSDPHVSPLAVLNPRHGGEILLRTTLLPSLLHVARHNVNADCALPLKLMQIGKSFIRRDGEIGADTAGDDLLPREIQSLQAAIVGDRSTGLGDMPTALSELKALVREISAAFRLDLDLGPDDSHPSLHNGGAWRISDARGEDVGYVGIMLQTVAADYEIDLPIAVLDLDLAAFENEAEPIRYKRFSRYPAVKRDLSLLVPADVPYDRILERIQASGGPLLRRTELFDLYRGASLGADRYSLGIRLKFQSDKGNLKSKAVDKAITAITGNLQTELGVELRV